MNPSPDLIDFLKGWEGCVLTPYRDVAGQWTCGIGHLLTSGSPLEPWTTEQAEAQLASDLERTWNGLAPHLTSSPTQNQGDALLSLAFNVGAHAVGNSTLVTMFNAGDISGASQQFLRWDLAAGKEIPGLLARREAEKAIWDSGDYSGRP
jgi:lysozyme